MVAQNIGTAAVQSPVFLSSSVAKGLGPEQRKDLSLQALVGPQSIRQLAADNQVSRKFVAQQRDRARQAVDEAFAAPAAAEDGERVLFNLPVTRNWIRQWVLSQVLIGRSSYRAVGEIFEAVFGEAGPSVGTVHNIVAEVLPRARAINQAIDLGSIRVGAHDEIYQADRPVFVGIDVASLYCYLLSEEDHVDEDTWGVRLLELTDQGLRVDFTVADGGAALRAGQRLAWIGTPCRADVFHAEMGLTELDSFLKRRAAGCTATVKKLQGQLQQHHSQSHRHKVSQRLAAALDAEAPAVELSADISTLVGWMKRDILSAAGPSLADRQEMFDFVVAELARREPLCPHRIGPLVTSLTRHRDNLLAFAATHEERFDEVARQTGIPAYMLQRACQLEGLDPDTAAYWQFEGQLRHQLKDRFPLAQRQVRQIIRETRRASSAAENLNRRLRNYFVLRRDLGDGYLDLLRFYLNHHRFQRSECPQRVGRSPAELLTGRPHAHWLELLGCKRPVAA